MTVLVSFLAGVLAVRVVVPVLRHFVAKEGE